MNHNMLRSEEFRCPKCCSKVIKEESGLICGECHERYLIKDGIIDFRYHKKFYYWDPIPSDDMDVLLQKAEGDSWTNIVRELLRYKPDLMYNLLADGRYAWKTLLNLNQNTVLLDFGCGLGNFTKNIAPLVSKVYALDLTYKRLQFTKKHLSIFNPKNNVTFLAGGDGEYLPFPDNTLDCVVLVGVLEWVGEEYNPSLEKGNKLSKGIKLAFSCFGKNSPRISQLNLLKEIKRILKPEGQIFIAIENRFNYEYFLGRPDHHSYLKYTSLLPRFISNVYSILASTKPYRTYSYCILEYKKLLHDAGFLQVDIFGMLNGYNDLKEIFPVEANIPEWIPLPPSNFKEKIKRSKYFVPSYGIVSSSSKKPHQRLQGLLFKQIEKDFAKRFNNAPITLRDYFISGRDKGVIVGLIGKQPIVIKILFNSSATFLEQQNFIMLQYINSFTKKLAYCPESLTHGEFNGLCYFVETQCKGENLGSVLIKQGRIAFIDIVSEVLEELNPSLKGRPEKFLTEEFYQQEVYRNLEILFQVIEERDLQKALINYFHDNLYGLKVSCGIRHGDFGIFNILIQDGKVSGLIDWGLGSKESSPVLDAITYLENVQRLFNPGQTLLQTIPLLASGRLPIPEERDFLFRQYDRCGIDISHHGAMVYLFWLRSVALKLEFMNFIYDIKGIEEQIKKVVKILLSSKS